MCQICEKIHKFHKLYYKFKYFKISRNFEIYIKQAEIRCGASLSVYDLYPEIWANKKYKRFMFSYCKLENYYSDCEPWNIRGHEIIFRFLNFELWIMYKDRSEMLQTVLA